MFDMKRREFLTLVVGAVAYDADSRQSHGMSPTASGTVPPSLPVISSAGVFDSNSKLVRTIWSAQANDPRVSNPVAAWDGTLDDGTVAPSGTYYVQVLTHNCTYTWEGVVGNSSADHSVSVPTGIHDRQVFTQNYHSYGGQIWGLCITPAGEMYFTTGYDERMNTIHLTTTANFNTSNGVGVQGFRNTLTGMHACCTDGINVYWGHDGGGNNSLVFGIVCATKQGTVFSSGTPADFGIGTTIYQISISSDAGGFITDLAVQTTGNNILFVCRSGDNKISTLNKTTGAALVDFTSFTGLRNIAANPVTGDLWVIHTVAGSPVVSKMKVSAGGVLTDSGVAINGLTAPLELEVSPDGSMILVADGGTSQQVKAFNTSDGSAKVAWGSSGVLGTPGGYTNSPAVTNTKFAFFSDMGFAGQFTGTFIAFAPDGSFWLGDNGNCRYLHFSSGNSPTYIEQFGYIPAFYQFSLCRNDPTRLFLRWLEFKIDYTKPLLPGNGSWTLVNNWRGKAPDPSAEGQALDFTATLGNGRTYAQVYDHTKNPQMPIYELTVSGLRSTGVTTSQYNYIDAGFNIWSVPNVGPGQKCVYRVNRLTGFDGSGNPQYQTDPKKFPSIVALTSQVLPAMFPETGNGDHNATTSMRVEPLANGVIPVFNASASSSLPANNHIGGISSITGNVTFSAHPASATNRGGSYLLYPTELDQDAFDQSTWATGETDNAGGPVIWIPGASDWFTTYNGEDWGSNQTNMIYHWHQSGLLINRFGTAAPYFGPVTSLDGTIGTLSASNVDASNNQTDAALWANKSGRYGFLGFPGLAGNARWSGIASQQGAYFIYQNDEWYHGGCHRWRIDNLSSITTASVTVNWNSRNYIPPTVGPPDLLQGLPYNTFSIPNGAGGWQRSPAADTGPPNEQYKGVDGWIRIYTNAIRANRHESPDLVFECASSSATVASPYTLSKSWTRLNPGQNWTLNAEVLIWGNSVATRGNLYIDILDGVGKKIVRMENLMNVTGTQMMFQANGAPVRTPLNPAGDGWQNFTKNLWPLIVSWASGNTMQVTYSSYTITITGTFDVGADITNPSQIMLTYAVTPPNFPWITVIFNKLQFIG